MSVNVVNALSSDVDDELVEAELDDDAGAYADELWLASADVDRSDACGVSAVDALLGAALDVPVDAEHELSRQRANAQRQSTAQVAMNRVRGRAIFEAFIVSLPWYALFRAVAKSARKLLLPL